MSRQSVSRQPVSWQPVSRQPAVAMTEQHAGVSAWFAAAADHLGLTVSHDRAGNQWAWWGDPDAVPGVATGSHLDSVPGGGAHAGPLGVNVALAAVDVLRRDGFRPARPIGVARFAKAHPPGTLGRDEVALRRLAAFVEVGLEAGTVLADAGAPIGLASHGWAHGTWRFDLPGDADHAAAAPLTGRRDPTHTLATLVLATREQALARDVLARITRLSTPPGTPSTIPSLVQAWLIAGAADEAALLGLVADLAAAAAAAGAGVAEEAYTAAMAFDAALAREVAAAVPSMPQLAARVGYDAAVLAAGGVPAALLLVRNPSGRTCCAEEFVDPADYQVAVGTLVTVLRRLTG